MSWRHTRLATLRAQSIVEAPTEHPVGSHAREYRNGAPTLSFIEHERYGGSFLLMRVALLADIHGNLPAFLAVQAELARIQPDAVVVNGDLINAVPFSGEVVDAVRAQPWCIVRGNHEFYYLDFGTPPRCPRKR